MACVELGELRMDTAKSIYLGGRKINANDPQLRKYSYRELGLTCPYCGEPVYLRSGTINRSHFAHYPEIDIQKYEECLLRQKSQGNFSFSDRHWWEEKERGQRFQLFQEHFVYIIKASIPSFNVRGMKSDPASVRLTKMERETLEYAQQKSRDHVGRYVRLFLGSGSRLEREIIVEAFSYLLILSSKNIFQRISEYVLENNAIPKESELKSWNICELIIDFLSEVKWIYYLERITSISIPKDESCLREYVDFAVKVENYAERYVYLDDLVLWMGSKKFCNINDEKPIAKLDVNRLLKSQYIAQQEILEVLDVGNPKFLKFERSGILFEKYQSMMKKDFSVAFKKSLQGYLRENKDEQFKWRTSDGYYLRVNKRHSSLMKDKESVISLTRFDGGDYSKVARMLVNTSLKRQKKIYKFNNFLVPDIYFSEAIENENIAKAMFLLLQRFRDALRRK